MKNILKVFKTKTAKTTGLYYFGNFTLNVLRYFFHLVLLRLLTPPEYGEFLSYLSLMYLLAIPTGTVASVVTKTAADLIGKEDTKSLNYFFYYLLKKTSLFAIGAGVLLIWLSSPLATVLKAHPGAFVILGISTIFSIFQTIISSFLAAFQKFVTQTVLGFLNIFLTITFSVIFIKIGLSATGAVAAQILSGIIISAISLYLIRDYIYPSITTSKVIFPTLKKFTFYSFIYSLGTMSLVSVDILMVRALFDTHVSGMYSSLSILGRMILFGLSPLIGLVLPMVTVRHAKKEYLDGIFYKLFFLIFGLGSIGALIFTLAPKTVISILSGQNYLSVSPLLSTFAISMVAFALSQFLLSFYIAIDKPKANLYLLVATAAQPVLIYFFGTSMAMVVNINFVINLLLVFSLCALKFSHGQETHT